LKVNLCLRGTCRFQLRFKSEPSKNLAWSRQQACSKYLVLSIKLRMEYHLTDVFGQQRAR
jgi:hypothetical protein